MPIIECIGLEPMQPTYFFGRNRTIYFIVIASWLPSAFPTYISVCLAVFNKIFYFIFLENLRFLINNVITSVPCEIRTHAPQIKNLML